MHSLTPPSELKQVSTTCTVPQTLIEKDPPTAQGPKEKHAIRRGMLARPKQAEHAPLAASSQPTAAVSSQQ